MYSVLQAAYVLTASQHSAFCWLSLANLLSTMRGMNNVKL